MRLINTMIRKVEEFYNKIPEYAILSHTWDEREMTLQDMEQPEPEEKRGFEKVDRCCKLVAQEGFEYVWIDTCCIDKNSSAELSEAINSMYRGYKEAQICVTYLSDVPSAEDPSLSRSSFRTCRWFTRGWTLQELIAPAIVEFYGTNAKGDWTEIGTKLSLEEVISEITGIATGVLRTGDMRSISLAKRMSWASRRETRREEDRAYSLMGLFDVNMPMIYGEGKRAFIRLQEEIVKIQNDYSLFAWTADKTAVRDWSGQGLLADCPSDFVHSHQIERVWPLANSGACQMTTMGLCMQIPLVKVDGKQCVILNCYNESRPDYLLGVEIRRFRAEDERYARYDSNNIVEVARQIAAVATKETVYIRQNEEHPWKSGRIRYVNVSLSMEPLDNCGYEVSNTYPTRKDNGSIRFLSATGFLNIGAYKFENKEAGKFVVVIGYTSTYLWCDILTTDDRNLEMICGDYSRREFRGSDRVNCRLSEGILVNVATKKRGPMFKTQELYYDVGYTLYVKFSEI